MGMDWIFAWCVIRHAGRTIGSTGTIGIKPRVSHVRLFDPRTHYAGLLTRGEDMSRMLWKLPSIMQLSEEAHGRA